MTTPFVRHEHADGFATITLDSPHNRNALSTQLAAELGDALRAAATDDEVRAAVLTHAGGTFCAGADLSEAAVGDRAAADARTRSIMGLIRQIVELPKPVIAQVDGHVRAGGMGLVAACDIAVAGPSSSFALTEVRLGLAPYMVSLVLLPKLAPRAAERCFLTAEPFDAQAAREMGLVSVVADDPAHAVRGLCDALGKASPRGLAETKLLTTAGVLDRLDRLADEMAARSARAFASDEAQEGMASFFEKRAPRWAL